MNFVKLNTAPVLLSLVLAALSSPATAADADDLTSMLHEFLANATTEAVHERFWAEDLIYTSSSGGRTTKAEIMQSFATADELDDDSQDEEPSPIYTAEEIQIRLYGTTAVVAFRLVASPSGESKSETDVQQYFNTGTFVTRDGRWQVVAWQATIIPGP